MSLVWVCQPCVAQSSASAGSSGGDSKDENPFDAKEAFGTILVAGLVGGILGISTLSFYDQPNKHVKNVTYGAGLGMIGAALYMTLSIASSSNVNGSKEGSAAQLEDSKKLLLAPTLGPQTVGLMLNYKF